MPSPPETTAQSVPMPRQDLLGGELPADALRFVGELLLEVTRRLPPALGRPPQLPDHALTDPPRCADAARALLRWFEAVPETLDQRIEEVEAGFGSLLKVVEEVEGRIHRAVLQARRRVEEDMTFARTIQEVLEQICLRPETGNGSREPVAQLLRHLAAKGEEDRAEAAVLSSQFDIIERSLAQLKAQITRVERRTRELRAESLRDGLTGLWNRRAYEQRLGEEVARAERHRCPLSIALWDVDRLETLNVAHGPRVGDLALQSLSGRILGLLRRSDFVARCGGEGFAVILPNTELSQALLAGEKIRSAVEAEPVSSPAGPLALTVSVGLAAFGAGDTPASLAERAGAALCRAKVAGRNRIEAEMPPGSARLTELP